MSSVYDVLTVVGVGLAAIYTALWIHLRATQDPREPVAAETKLPYITPIIGLSKHTYFAYLRKQYPKLPIFTLRLPGQRIYVVNDAQLISAIQRQHRTLSFQAVEDGFSDQLLHLSPAAKEIQKREFHEWRLGPTHLPSPGHLQFRSMAPGKQLNHMNRMMLKSLEDSVKSWIPEGQQTRKIRLFDWVKETMLLPTTDGFYGPDNPYRDPKARENFWTFFKGLPLMSQGMHWFAKDSVAASLFLGRTFNEYYQQGGHEKYIGFTKHAFEYYQDRGVAVEDLAQLTAGTSVAALGNTIPAAFWLVVRLYSDRKVLEACREEILAQVVRTKDEDGNPVHTVDVDALKTTCPLLQSAFKEVLRRESIGIGVRKVVEDHLLDGKYLLRKDALIFMPLVSQHFDHARWGADAEEYCYDRFADKTRPRVNNISFRAFGGGTTLCPGRHFATTELLAFAAMLLLRFELVPKDGKWFIPTSRNADLTTTMPKPDFDVDVEMKKKKDDEGVRWVWKLSESEDAVMLEDQAE